MRAYRKRAHIEIDRRSAMHAASVGRLQQARGWPDVDDGCRATCARPASVLRRTVWLAYSRQMAGNRRRRIICAMPTRCLVMTADFVTRGRNADAYAAADFMLPEKLVAPI